MAPTRELHISIVDLEPFQGLLKRLLHLHQPTNEEAELWGDQDGHADRFPDCPGDCDGHTFTLQVCKECGYEHDGDGAIFRAWPCPTIKAVLALTKREESPEPGPPEPQPIDGER